MYIYRELFIIHMHSEPLRPKEACTTQTLGGSNNQKLQGVL